MSPVLFGFSLVTETTLRLSAVVALRCGFGHFRVDGFVPLDLLFDYYLEIFPFDPGYCCSPCFDRDLVHSVCKMGLLGV